MRVAWVGWGHGGGGGGGIQGKDTAKMSGEYGPVSGLGSFPVSDLPRESICDKMVPICFILGNCWEQRNPHIAGGFKEPLLNSPPTMVIFKCFSLHSL